MSSLQIQILVEDTAHKRYLRAEHGLAFWVHHNEKYLLFDTGQSPAFVANAHHLQVDLKLAEAVVFSHGHYDHVGGAIAALEAAPSATVYLHPDALDEKFAAYPEGATREVGMPDDIRQYLNLSHQRLTKVSESTEIWPGAHLTGPIPRESGFEDVGGRFFKDSTGQVADLIADDMATSFLTSKGIVVIVGCAHAGIVNTLNHISAQHPNHKLLAVIGGFHLLNASENRLEKTIEALKEFPDCVFHPNHCTGFKATLAMASAFGKRCRPLHTGDTIHFP